jgi:hypothetical protein
VSLISRHIAPILSKTLLTSRANDSSPVTIFAETAQALPAERKIRMLRLFTECLELSEPSSDGWTVIGALVRSYNQESVPLPENSCNWLLRTLSTDGMVACGPQTIWHGLQNAVRSFLVREHESLILQRLLNPNADGSKIIDSSQGASIAHWFALQASQRELLPMIIEAGTRLHMNGFDWNDDSSQETTAAMFSRQLPVIYAAWAKAMPGGIERADELVASELDASLEKAKWTRDSLREFISDTTDVDPRQEADHSKRCSACLDDYSSLGTGLVAPAWIAFTECTTTRHRFKCACRDFLQSAGLPARPPLPESSITSDPQDNASTDSDAEEWAEACEKQVDDSQDDANYRPSSDTERADEELAHGSDSDGSGDTSWRAACEHHAQQELANTESEPFRASATLLYRAQGRTWLAAYEPGDRLCATCFLGREEYIGKDGLGAEKVFSDMPPEYAMFSPAPESEGVSCER